MKVTLNPSEILHIYQLLLKNPMSDASSNKVLVDKLERPISESLEKEYSRINSTMYKAWEDKEQKKIEELNESLNDVKVSYSKSVPVKRDRSR